MRGEGDTSPPSDDVGGVPPEPPCSPAGAAAAAGAAGAGAEFLGLFVTGEEASIDWLRPPRLTPRLLPSFLCLGVLVLELELLRAVWELLGDGTDRAQQIIQTAVHVQQFGSWVSAVAGCGAGNGDR